MTESGRPGNQVPADSSGQLQVIRSGPIAVIFDRSGKITVFVQYPNESDSDDTADRRSDDHMKYTQIQQDDCQVVRKTD